MFKHSQRPFKNSSTDSRELITQNSNKNRSGLTGIEFENRDANIENQDALIENRDVVIENRVSILDSIPHSCEDRESSVNLLLNGPVTTVSLYKSTEPLCFDFESSSAAFFIRSLGFQSHFPLGVAGRERVNNNKPLY